MKDKYVISLHGDRPWVHWGITLKNNGSPYPDMSTYLGYPDKVSSFSVSHENMVTLAHALLEAAEKLRQGMLFLEEPPPSEILNNINID